MIKGIDIHKGYTKWHMEKTLFFPRLKKHLRHLIFVLKKISNRENSKLSQIAHTKGIGKNNIFT
jgi:hypothetical protein